MLLLFLLFIRITGVLAILLIFREQVTGVVEVPSLVDVSNVVEVSNVMYIQSNIVVNRSSCVLVSVSNNTHLLRSTPLQSGFGFSPLRAMFRSMCYSKFPLVCVS